MCSLSWVQNDQSLVICFNRDEGKTRSVAIPPRTYSKSNCNVIMPKDQDGGGTWLAVNQFGIVVALLNLYANYNVKIRSRLSEGKKRSRGLLVKELSTYSNLTSFDKALRTLDLSVYPSFELVFISLTEKYRFIWDGNRLDGKPLAHFSSSSSYEGKEVIASRKMSFQQLNNKTRETLIKLHSTHAEEKKAYSICMHRDDAQTVSMSCIEINAIKINYQYWDGAPCKQLNSSQQEMLINRTYN